MKPDGRQILQKARPKDFSTLVWASLLTLLIQFVIGPCISEHRSQPRIHAAVQQLAFSKDFNGIDWYLTAIVRMGSDGDKPITAEYARIRLDCPAAAPVPLSFEVKRTVTLESRQIKYDTLEVRIPDIFQEPSFRAGAIQIVDVLGRHVVHARFDSSDVVLGFAICTMDTTFRFGPARAGSSGPLPQLEEYPIVFDGQTYMNYVYSPGFVVSYRVEKDRVKVRYTGKDHLALPADSGKTRFIPYPVFVPDPMLAPHLDLPRHQGLAIHNEVEEGGQRTVRYYTLETLSRPVQYHYVFKDAGHGDRKAGRE